MIINELARLVGIERTRFQSNCKVKIDKDFKNPTARLTHGFSRDLKNRDCTPKNQAP